ATGPLAPRCSRRLRRAALAFTRRLRRGCGNGRLQRSRPMVVRLQQSRARLQDEGRARARISGEEANMLYPGCHWNDVEQRMADEWGEVRGKSRLSWAQVREDAHVGWQVAQLCRTDRMCDDAPVVD